MSNSGRSRELDCNGARETIQSLLDAEIIDAKLEQRLQTHLSHCSGCRALDSDLRTIQGALQSMPETALPDPILQNVWDRTIRADQRSASRFGGFHWKGIAAAAAAIVGITLFGVWQFDESTSQSPDAEELQRAARQTRMVLRLTSQALRRTGQVVIRDVLTDEVSPALRRVPIAWPQPSSAHKRGS